MESLAGGAARTKRRKNGEHELECKMVESSDIWRSETVEGFECKKESSVFHVMIYREQVQFWKDGGYRLSGEGSGHDDGDV